MRLDKYFRLYPYAGYITNDNFINRLEKSSELFGSEFWDDIEAINVPSTGTTHQVSFVSNIFTATNQYCNLNINNNINTCVKTTESVVSQLLAQLYTEIKSVTVQNLSSYINQGATSVDGASTIQSQILYILSNIYNEIRSNSSEYLIATSQIPSNYSDYAITAEELSLTVQTFVAIFLEVIDGTKTDQRTNLTLQAVLNNIIASNTALSPYCNITFSLSGIDGTNTSELIFGYLNSQTVVVDGSQTGQNTKTDLQLFLSSNSDTKTQVLTNAIINILLYNIVASYTQEIYNLDITSLTVHQLATVCAALTQEVQSLTLSFNCAVNYSSLTQQEVQVSLAQQVSTIISSKTAETGAIIHNIGLVSIDESNSIATFSFNLTSRLDTISTTLTALMGNLSIDEFAPIINIIDLLVYINMEESHNMNVNRGQLLDIYLKQRQSETVSIKPESSYDLQITRSKTL